MGSSFGILLGVCLVIATLPMGACAPGCVPAPAQSTRASALAGYVAINEIMYDPEGDEVSGEWVELLNTAQTSINLAGWSVSDQEGGVDFTFGSVIMPPSGLALVHVGPGTNDTTFSDGLAEFYMWKPSSLLSNTGDDILLTDAVNATVDFVSYGQWDGGSVHAPPPDFQYVHSNATAQQGFSLALCAGSLRSSVPTPLRANGLDWPEGSGILLSRVHYYAWGGNEFMAIHNPLQSAVDISSWYVTDGEGIAAFPAGTVIQPESDTVLAQNATNYFAQSLRTPDFEYGGDNQTVPDATVIGSAPVLSNTGDEVLLMNNYGTCMDAYVYGSSAYSGTGWAFGPAKILGQGDIARRNFAAGYQDTNTSSDWNNIRHYVVGQSEFGPRGYAADGDVTLFVSPDCSFGAVSGAVDNATSSIWLCVYEFTSQALADRLVAAAGRGLDVRLFLEGSPVGGMTPEEIYLARQVAGAGGQVRFMTNDPDNDIHERYSYVHAKYAVIDSDTLLITSENWGASGIPETGDTGNRGWGALVEDADTAAYFSQVFSEDWETSRPDSVPFDRSHPLWDSGTAPSHNPSAYAQKFTPLTVSSQTDIRPVLAPDTSLAPDTILGMMGSASERVYVEQFYSYKHWGDRSADTTFTAPNLYLEAAIDAARRGCEVRILLDSTYYNVMASDPIDNDDTVAYVNAIALAEGLDLQAKLVNATEHDFDKIHNKGVIADDSVLISSINWNLNSVTSNRESGVIIENAQAANYFAAVFAYDWQDDWTPPFAHFSLNTSYAANSTVVISASTSSDNVGIANYTWALDGQPVCWSMVFLHTFPATGQHVLNLTVTDAWGNAASYCRTLTILEEGSETPEDEGTASDSSMSKMLLMFLLIPVFIFIAILAVARLKRR